LTPNNINAFARKPTGKTPIKQGNDFVFNGDEPIEFEDENTTLHFFFPKDYAFAAADSVTDFINRANLKRVFFSQNGKHYLLVGVPWTWINSSPAGALIIDPTTNAATNEDVRLYDAGNYGTDTKLAVGKFPNTGNLKSRSVINFSLSGIPSNATVLNAQMKLKYYEKYNNTTGTWVDRWIQAHQLLLGWDEAQADSLERSTGVNWAAPRGKIGGTTPDANASYESSLLIVEDEALPVWKSWDLTALTQKWVSGAVANYGVLLWATNENTSGYVLRFYSSEATNTSDRPYLEVIWSQTPQTVYFLKDHLGSIRAAVSDSGKAATVIGFDDYDPWGYPLVTRSKPIPNAYLQGASKSKFIGMQLDDEFGLNLHHTPFRPYDGQIGRWVVMDPLASNNPGLSSYHYARNNPITRIDLLGLDDYYYNRSGEQVGVVETDDDDRYYIQDKKGDQSYKDNKYVQFTGGIFNATDAEDGEGKVAAVVAGEDDDPPAPEDAVALDVGGQTDKTKDWDFYTLNGQTWKVPNGYHVVITPSGEPKVIYKTGLLQNADVFGLAGPRRAFTGENFLQRLISGDEVSWVNNIISRVSARKPELKPFIRPTR